MDKDETGHEKPDRGCVQIGIKKHERDEAVDQDMEDLSQEAPNLQLIEFFKLEDEVRDEVRQDKFQEKEHAAPVFLRVIMAFFRSLSKKILKG
jgi:hypothetical protein